ncbi:MAG: c-type cytochrome, partial [Myxococcota bacterium]
NQAYTEAVMARAGTEVTEELLVAMAADSSAVAMGADIFAANCVVCHNARGEGNIGPNLTDDHWFHGGSPLNIHGTIANGVLDTNSPGGGGMPQWDGILGGQGTMRVTAYVLSIQNTFVEGKAAQGEVWPPPGGEGEEGSEEEGEAEAGSVEAGTVDTGAAEEAGAQHDPNAEDEAEDEGAAATEDGAEDSVEGPSAALEGEAPSDANPSDPTGETGAPSEGARPVIVRADETPE